MLCIDALGRPVIRVRMHLGSSKRTCEATWVDYHSRPQSHAGFFKMSRGSFADHVTKRNGGSGNENDAFFMAAHAGTSQRKRPNNLDPQSSSLLRMTSRPCVVKKAKVWGREWRLKGHGKWGVFRNILRSPFARGNNFDKILGFALRCARIISRVRSICFPWNVSWFM